MARAVGKAFKITKKQVKGYGYAKPGMRANPGVTAIAAINGRGAYGRSRSARAAVGGLSRNAALNRARGLTAAQRRSFGDHVRAATRKGPMKTNASRKQVAAARRNIKKAQAARAAWGRKLKRGTRYRVGEAHYETMPGGARKLPTGVYAANRRKKSMKSNTKRRRRQTPAQRRASLRNLAKARRKLKPNRAKKRTTKRRRKAAPKRRMRRNATRKQVAAARRNIKKAQAARRGKRRLKRNAKRRAAPKRRRATAKRRMRRNTKRRAAPKRRATAKRRMRRNTKRRAAPRRRRATAKRRMRRNTKRRAAPKRRMRRNTKRRAAPKRRRASARRRGYRRNSRGKAFRKNQFMATLVGAFKAGLLVTGGIVVHKGLSRVLNDFVLSKVIGTPVVEATPTSPPEAPAVSGLEALQPYKGLIASAAAAALGILVVNKTVKDVNTKVMVTSGMAASFLHAVLVTALSKAAPDVAGYLSGYNDSTAARLSAMYGLGAGTSIQPRYAPIGMGEYFTEGVAGLGEYFTEGVSGLGNYGPNPDLYQAAAGFGAMPNNNGNHIDPSSDLDRELSIAEAAAGVGQLPAYEAAAGVGRVMPFEASAGVGEYFTEGVAGLGNIQTVPTADTWIPGTTDGQLWAGVRAIDKRQSASEMVPAGILQTGGGQGVFG